MPQTTVSQVLGAAVRVVARSLVVGQKVVWTGFGTFEMRHRSRRHGINPQTRERIMIDSTLTPGFTASSTFKDRVLHQLEDGSDKEGAEVQSLHPLKASA